MKRPVVAKFNVRMYDGEMRDKIQRLANRNHRSMNSQISAWLDACIEAEENGLKIGEQLLPSDARADALERVVLRLLENGSWFSSAIELDRYVNEIDGKEFENELRAILAMPKTLDAADPMGQVVAVQKPVFRPTEGMPVKFKSGDKYKLGILRKIWVDVDHRVAFSPEKFRASVEGSNGNLWNVAYSTLEDPHE